MALLKQLQLLLTLGSLAAAAATPKAATTSDDNDTPLPVIIWHGLGDRFDNEGLVDFAQLIDDIHPGTYTHIVKQADSGFADSTASYHGSVNAQVDALCEALAADHIIATAPAIDAIGFSQGGQFLRAYTQRCNAPPVRSLITFGSQHNGITEFMKCSPFNFLCKGVDKILSSRVWGEDAQTNIVPAQYFRDPTSNDKYNDYLAHSSFLADINNEREVLRNATYAANLARLENFVMYMFEDDETAIPKESAWFAEVNVTGITPLRERALYKEDWLGLKKLDERGALHFRTIPGAHMALSNANMSAIVEEFLGPLKKGKASPKGFLENAADVAQGILESVAKTVVESVAEL